MPPAAPAKAICFRDLDSLITRLDAHAERMTAALGGAGKVTRTGLMRRLLDEGLDRLDAADVAPTDEK